MQGDPKWYDSVWLSVYYAAKDIVARVAPEKLEPFIRSFDVLRTRPDFSTVRLPQVIDPALLGEIRATVRAVPREKYEMHELKSFGRFVVHDLPEFTALQHRMTDQVSDWAGEAVEPSYNFLSLYTRMGICEPHLDSPSAKWTLDICIDQSEPWPIHFSKIIAWPEDRPHMAQDWRAEICGNADLGFESVAMMPGDAVLFSGSSQWHYREAHPRGGGKHFCDLLFFHYIPEGAGELIRANNWAALFGIPELADIPLIEKAR